MAFTTQWITSGALFARMGVDGYFGISAAKDGNTANTLDITIAASGALTPFALLNDGSFIDSNNGLVNAAVTGLANGTATLWLDHDGNMNPVWSVAASAPSPSALAIAIITTATGAITNVQMLPDRLSNLLANSDQSVFYSLPRTTPGVARNGPVIPANAVLTSVRVVVQTGQVSNAGTTATASVGKVGGTGTEFINAQDVKTAAGNFVALSGLGSVGTSPIQLQLLYSETGTASTAGGPFLVFATYYLPE